MSRTLLVPFLLAASALAQTAVVPVSLTNLNGPGSTAYPFGLSSATRVQNFFHRTETGFAGPTMIKSLEVRAQETASNAAKASIDLQISMSASGVGVNNVSTTFASNHGTNLTVVYTRKLTNIAATVPATPGQGGGVWPFDTPFLYVGQQGNLIVDYDIASQPTGTWSHDTTGTATAGTHTTVGTGCNGRSMNSTGGGLGSTLVFSTSGGVPNGASFLFLDFADVPGGIAVPGNPGCLVYVVPKFLVYAPLNASGTATVTLNVPEDANLRGSSLFGQFAVLNAALNLDTTPARQATFGAYLTGRIYNLTSNTAATGSVQLRSAVVLHLGI